MYIFHSCNAKLDSLRLYLKQHTVCFHSQLISNTNDRRQNVLSAKSFRNHLMILPAIVAMVRQNVIKPLSVNYVH